MNDKSRFRSFLSRLGTILLMVLLSPVTIGRRLLLSARAWVLFILLVIVTLIAYYVLSDRYTPLTTDAYVQAYVIQVAPRVEGQVVKVPVRENQAVHKGDLLFEIDRRPFQHRVDLLVAKRVQAVQQVAQLGAELSAAKAEDVRLVAEEAYARVVHEQEQAIYKQEATTDRKYVDAVQKYRTGGAGRPWSDHGRRCARWRRRWPAARSGPNTRLGRGGRGAARRGPAQPGMDPRVRHLRRAHHRPATARGRLHPHRPSRHDPDRHQPLAGSGGQLP